MQAVNFVDVAAHTSHVVPINALPPLPDDAYRIVCISDTHDAHRSFTIPEADVLLHAGDLQMCSRKFSSKDCRAKIEDVNTWLGTLPVPHKVVIGGNHDAYLESLGVTEAKAVLNQCSYLVYEDISLPHPRRPESIQPLWIYGAPFSAGHSSNSAFQLRKHPEAQCGGDKRRIPPSFIPVVQSGKSRCNTSLPLYDIVMTHSPQMARLDVGREPNKTLRRACNVHVGGHLHSYYGMSDRHGIPCVVACSLNSRYEPRNAPIVFDYVPQASVASAPVATMAAQDQPD